MGRGLPGIGVKFLQSKTFFMSCTHNSTRLVRRQHRTDWVSSRYECLSCGDRFTHYEPRVFTPRPMPFPNGKPALRARLKAAMASRVAPVMMNATPREIEQLGKFVGVRVHRIA